MQRHKSFTRYHLLVTLILSLLQPREAQPQDSCRQVLEEADKKYRGSRYAEAITSLARCLAKGEWSDAEKGAAYKLLSKAYLAQGQRDSAKTAVKNLLKSMPAWRPDIKNDTKSFNSFAEEVLKEVAAKPQEKPCQSFAQTLDQAGQQIRQTNFEAAIKGLNDCLNQGGLTAADTLRAFPLLIRAYLGLRVLAQAEQAAEKLLRAAPGYQPTPEETPEYRKLIEKVRKQIFEEPQQLTKKNYAPRRLFYLADANVLSSFEITLGFGTHLGFASEEQRFPYLFHAGIGLGDIAELEFRSVEIVNKLGKGKPELITGALKLGLSEGRFFAAQPAVAGVIRLTISNWGSEEHPKGKFDFQKKLDTYHLIFSKQLKSVRLHGGIGKNILRFRIRDAVTGEYIVALDSLNYINRQGPIRFFGGLQWRVNTFSMFMLENWYLAKYNLHEAQPAQNTKEDLEEQHLVSVGIRFFPSRGLAFDAAVIKRTGLSEVDDDGISFKLGLNFGLSSLQLFQDARQNN